MINIDKESLKTLIENGRKNKKISQRELSRRIGLSHSSVNDLENGRVQKPDVEILINIAKELDISFKEILIVAGYKELVYLLITDINKGNI